MGITSNLDYKVVELKVLSGSASPQFSATTANTNNNSKQTVIEYYNCFLIFVLLCNKKSI